MTFGFGRRDAWRTGLAIAGVALLAVALAGPALRLGTLVGASDWGSDWRWLDDGLRRLAEGLPLIRPEYVAGPFSQFNPGPTDTWSLHPPFTASILAVALALPASIREAAWTLLMAGTLAAAFWLAWPRRLWPGTHLLIACAVVGSPWLGLWMGVVDQVHYANPNALVALGVVLTWQGRRRGSAAFVALGLVLAALKIVPAIGLACWLLASPRIVPSVRRGVVLALVALVALTVPILLRDPGAVGDTIRAQMNLVPLTDATNLSPRLLLAPILGPGVATAICYGIPLGLFALVVIRRLDGPAGLLLVTLACLFLTPQLWAHWFIIPAIAALIAAGEWPKLRQLDAALRRAWQRPGVTAAPIQAAA